MPDGVPTLGELGRRLNVLEREVDELRELVDGQEAWSHRKRLHDLENERDAAKLVSQALDAFRKAQHGRWAQARQWASFVLAVAAVVVAILARTHGGG
jgi:type VI protein secretion system component VasF